MTTPITVVEQAIVDEFTGRIDRAAAIATVRSVLNLTDLGAADLLDHPTAPRARYEVTGT